MKRKLLGSVTIAALALSLAGPLAVSGVQAQTVYNDWTDSYQFPSPSQQAVNLQRAHLMKLTEEGFFEDAPNYNITNHVKQDFYQDCSAAGSCPENNAYSIGNQVITTVSCTKGATCVGIESGANVNQDNDHSTQSSSISTKNVKIIND